MTCYAAAKDPHKRCNDFELKTQPGRFARLLSDRALAKDSAGLTRHTHLRALAQRVEVDQKELRIMGSKGVLLRTLVAAESAKTAGFGVPSSVPKWRGRHDSNARPLPSERG
jgi:hypothetical protein